jgi:hypothetical protein
MRLACTVPDAGCDQCPPSTACVDGCCEIDAAPPDCASAIDITAGGIFHASVCGGAPRSSTKCAQPYSSPYLILHVGPSSGDAGTFAITTPDPNETHVRLGYPCEDGGGSCPSPMPPWTVDAGSTFALQVAVDDPCAHPFSFEVTPQ